MAGVSAFTDTQTSIDESVIDTNQLVSTSIGKSGPTITIATSASSLFTETSVVTISTTWTVSMCQRPITQVTVSSCQAGHYRQHTPQMVQLRGVQMMANPTAHSESSPIGPITPRASIAFSLHPQTVTTQNNSHINSQGIQMLQQMQCRTGAMPHFTNANPVV